MSNNNKYIIYEIGAKKKHPTKLSEVLPKKGIRPMQLAANSGVANNIISNLLSGIQTNLHLDNAKKICNILDCTLDEAFGDGKIDHRTQILDFLDKQMAALGKEDADGFFLLTKVRDFAKSMK
jgi:DNA-binding Xre family transcriptional regulator